MKWKVLISAPYMQPVVDRFRGIFDEHGIEIVIPEVRERLSESELLSLIGEIDGVICGDDHFTEKVLQAAPRLKVISKWGTGVDSIDAEACVRLGVLLCNKPNAFTEPVADSVLGYILCFARQLPWMDTDLKSGIWTKRPCRALNECTLGVIGVGNIGKAVVQRANAFGMQLVVNDVAPLSAKFVGTDLQITDKETVLREADFVSLNCDLNPTSYHLLGEREFSLMKETAVVINMARGPLIDEVALITALQNRHIAGAALDVYEQEPLPKDSPLRRMDNVLLAPHNSNSSPTAWERVHHSTIRNLLAGLKGASQ